MKVEPRPRAPRVSVVLTEDGNWRPRMGREFVGRTVYTTSQSALAAGRRHREFVLAQRARQGTAC